MGAWVNYGMLSTNIGKIEVSTSKHRAEKGTEYTCASCSEQFPPPLSTCFDEIALLHPHCRNFYEWFFLHKFNTMLNCRELGSHHLER